MRFAVRLKRVISVEGNGTFTMMDESPLLMRA